MNKTFKGAIAVAAATAVVTGGAGSLAYWSSSDAVGAGSVSSGKLTLTAASGAGTWKNGTQTINTIANYKIVPGDVLVYTKTFTVAAAGNNLAATVAVDPTAATGDLKNGVTVAADVLKGANAVTTLTSADDNQQLTARVTLTFPSTVSGVEHQTKSLDMSAIRITATQTAPGTSGN